MDPTMGYNHAGDEGITGFKRFGDPFMPCIVTLGNSTTDPWQFPFKCWSEYLYDELSRHGVDACVLCGGVSGYMSPQETLKLLRDVLPLRPCAVICFEGFQDIHMLFREKAYPFISKYQKLWLSSLEINQRIDIYYTRGYDLGVDSCYTPYQVWKNSMRVMHAICSEFDIEFFGILQPTVYNALPVPKKKEWEILLHCEVRDDYLKLFDEFFREYKNDTWKPSYVYDFTKIFKIDGLFIDTVHVTQEGNKIIAENIFSILQSVCMRLRKMKIHKEDTNV